MEFVEAHFIHTIRQVCASQEGCPGVSLREAVIRPACCRGNGASPVLCAYRKDDQVIGVSELIRRRDEIPGYEHSWEQVVDEEGKVVLDAGKDGVALLLRGEERQYSKKKRKEGERRGLAVLISVGEEERPGAAADREKLEKLARDLNFEVRLEVNKTAQELRKLMTDIQVGKYVRAEDECFMCFVNAHGDTNEGAQYIWDGITEASNELKKESDEESAYESAEESGEGTDEDLSEGSVYESAEEFAEEYVEESTEEWEDHHLWVLNDLVWPITRCSLLSEKPKLFFINACRGHSWIVADAGPGKHLESSVPDLDKTRREGQEIHSLKEETDCLFVFSTTDDTVSFRDRKEGTYFVRALVEAFEERGQPTNVLDIMTRMNDKVKEMRVQKMGSQDTFGQAPVVVSTLVKTLRL
eukprot:TRINITY_DN2499_c1_g1_i9.p1 TRINITY_DN2499_c1_g1~~TRINITY_DN2499_c1_g1_i9.p1  ORF type:complete len:422 (-),score=92.39 TRINITY_DN2499_c1_g1_i9:33-1271(-)